MAITNDSASREKAQGIHYTPEPLANFVARQVVKLLGEHPPARVRVLDPACGDGELLLAAGRLLLKSSAQVELVGFDADEAAAQAAEDRLKDAFGSSVTVSIAHRDFLASVLAHRSAESELWSELEPSSEPALLSSFDLVIANPPYVRTQVLGAEKAQQLAAAFGLSGRVDLYQAFVLAIGDVVKDGAPVGLIVSNRFLTVKGGSALRHVLARNFTLDRIVDLGDTKLFQAAVLPALIFGHRSAEGSTTVPMTSVYEERAGSEAQQSGTDLFGVLESGVPGVATIDGRDFLVRHGLVQVSADARPWVAAGDDDSWLTRVDKATHLRLGQIGKIRVGVKTTADSVFIHESWEDVSPGPENNLLLPLVTHHCAARWRAADPVRQMLYPYDLDQSRRTPVDLEAFPMTLAYLETHKERLTSRKYVIEGGRLWWEIWVPQRPSQWKLPRLVFPDISEKPCFFLDESGAVVNGDCYWLSFTPEQRDVALLALGVANSTLAERYYDARCGNKLYAGRRRFITQYVEDFPIPDPASEAARKIVSLVAQLASGTSDADELERQVDDLVWRAFEVEDMRG